MDLKKLFGSAQKRINFILTELHHNKLLFLVAKEQKEKKRKVTQGEVLCNAIDYYDKHKR